MEQIIIRVKDKAKSKMLVEILQTMNFVDLVSAEGGEESREAQKEKDFFALAGLWEGRNINLETIRKTWPSASSPRLNYIMGH